MEIGNFCGHGGREDKKFKFFADVFYGKPPRDGELKRNKFYF
jgi:hypothetical protein